MMTTICRECQRELEPNPPQRKVCSDRCRRQRARRAKRTYRKKQIGQLTEQKYRQTEGAKERARQRQKRHLRKKKNVAAWVKKYEVDNS